MPLPAYKLFTGPYYVCGNLVVASTVILERKFAKVFPTRTVAGGHGHGMQSMYVL